MIEINVALAESTQLELLHEGVLALNRDLMSAGFAPQVVISKQGLLCTPGRAGLTELTCDAFAGLVRSHCIPVKVRSLTQKEIDKAEAAGKDVDAEVCIELPSLSRPLVRSYMESRRWEDDHDLPQVRQVAPAPIVRPDFTIRWERGWDEATGTWVTPGLKEDRRLIDSGFDLRTLFDAFPLSDRALTADCLAAALTPLISTAIEGALPAMIVSARKPGSGKTELSILCSMLGNGGGKTTSWRTGDEFSKLLNTYVATDQRAVIFDNIKTTIEAPELEGVITNRTVSYRRMHSHTEVELHSNTTFYMTANGATVSPDMVRRSIVIMLDKDAHPVTWDGTLKKRVKVGQAALVTLMCHMIEQWRIAGCPAGSVDFSNFEEWSRTTSGILECAGIAGMFTGREVATGEAIHTDDEAEGAVIEAIAELMGGGEWKSGELVSALNDRFSDASAGVISAWVGSRSPVAVGKALHRITGKSVSGCSVVLNKRTLSGTTVYEISTTDGSELPIKAPNPTF